MLPNEWSEKCVSILLIWYNTEVCIIVFHINLNYFKELSVIQILNNQFKNKIF